ncbi:hypothetical protein NHF48_000925 [Sphingomonas sp. H160509]|uniref:hypothetical protein n=1 Tax=Sphingomonas sp. H160509 TaxID=2955313 RepID=UPI0020969029|nr:hypothetical protein [Sphingomonas sp. H160509]MDD1449820.1 hypothetical protein [Sphingomonas sp. H160509]
MDRRGAFIADDRLQSNTLERLDEVVAPPAAGPVIDELEASIQPWLSAQPLERRFKLIILPPCDESDIVGVWAEREGHTCLQPPPRDTLCDANLSLENLPASGLLVVSRLERWFLRERGCLKAVRNLLDVLQASDRPCVIACNSWAWSYLRAAIQADAVMPEGLVFKPFDGPRLQHWFSDLACNDLTQGVRFRSSATGKDVLSRDDDGESDGEFFERLGARSRGVPWVAWHLWRRSLRRNRDDGESDGEFFERLGARSRGVPWVAWHLWRRSLRRNRDDGSGETAAEAMIEPGEETLWIAALDELVLPGEHPQSALLVFHALLIHGVLTIAELHRTVPAIGQSNVVSALVMSGFLERDGEGVRCRAAAYPAIRQGLSKAGYPMDEL